MTEHQLGMILKDMYENAPKGFHVAQIHHFGVKYAEVIISNDYKAKDIIRESGLNASYATELSKGIKLSKYVVSKQ